MVPSARGRRTRGLANVNELAHARARGLAGRAGHWEAGVPGGTGDGLGPTFSEAEPPFQGHSLYLQRDH